MNGLVILALAAQLATSAPQVPAVDIVLFSDFHCPFCAQLAAPLRALQSTPMGDVALTIQFKHYPLAMHPEAGLAHRAALAAGAQNKFWEMHDLLFANRQRAKREDLIAFASQLGLDPQRFAEDLDSPRTRQALESDQAEGTRRGVVATPTFYVNGREYVGARSLAQLKQIVESVQRRARALTEISDQALSRGPADAAITIELFADLQSPVTGRALAVLNAAIEPNASDIRVQFRNFPLAFHPQAALAHEAAMIAARGGRFWEFADYLVAHQDAVREQDLIALARRIGLDEKSFAEALTDRRYAPRVEADLEDGAKRGLRGSPVIVINGKRIDGVPSLQTLSEYVATARKQLVKGR
jgi:protein-disulfide isomerase